MRGDERWDFQKVAKAAGVRVLNDHGSLVCGWWLQTVADPKVIFAWYLAEIAKLSNVDSWSPWQPITEGQRPKGSLLAQLLLSSADYCGSRLGVSTDEMTRFWDKRLPKPDEAATMPLEEALNRAQAERAIVPRKTLTPTQRAELEGLTSKVTT